MNSFNKRLIFAMKKSGITAANLSRLMNLNEGTISSYKKGAYIPKQQRMEELAAVLGVSAAWLSGGDAPMERDIMPKNTFSIGSMKSVPLLGTIACGKPILARENYDESVAMPDFVNADFALKCTGDSMIGARIYDGDIVYIKQQEDVENGEIAAVLIDDEATLKRVYKYPDMVILRPENSAFSEMVYEKEEINHIHILGKAVGFYSAVR